MGVETSTCVLEIKLGPLADVRKGTLSTSLALGVGAGLRRGEGVVESLCFYGNELLILALKLGAKEAEGEVEGG